jgi:hypothetical protein
MRGSRPVPLCGALVLLLALVPGRLLAWDASTTHSGLTERAVAASKLHATLVERLARPLGGFEPLRLDGSTLDAEVARSLKARLDRLDPAGGCRPSADGVATAAAWVRAGAVLEKTPPERGRHHFFEPARRAGLDDAPGLSGTLHAVRLTLDDGATVREAATGLAFTLDGMPAIDWLRSAQNDLGLPGFFDHWARAASGGRAVERETELVRALLALGGSLAVLEDMGQPAFVRNDFRGEFLADDAGSAFERFVADRYGAVALPAAAAPVARGTVESYFFAGDGQGLAQRTQSSFFSAGTLPGDLRVDHGDDRSEIERLLNQRLSFPGPAVRGLDLVADGKTRYLRHDGARVAAYQVLGGRLHFFLDPSVYRDAARRWLPVIEGYAAGLVDHLLRVRVELATAEGSVTVAVRGVIGTVAPGALLHVLAEDASGLRKEIAQAPLRPDVQLTFVVPAGARKLAAYGDGSDDGGRFVAVAEIGVP